MRISSAWCGRQLAHRFPVFEAAKCHRTWSGLYEQCELDGNPIIGNWPGTLDNFHVCSGFSGHGMMHAPAAGRAIAERIIHGRDRIVDLARLGYERVVADLPYASAESSDQRFPFPDIREQVRCAMPPCPRLPSPPLPSPLPPPLPPPLPGDRCLAIPRCCRVLSHLISAARPGPFGQGGMHPLQARPRHR